MESLVQRENSGIEIAGPLSLSQLKNIAYLIESELAILLDDLADLCHTEQKSGIRDQILINFPVMSLEKASVTILYELVLQPSTFTSLFELLGPKEKGHQESTSQHGSSKESSSKSHGRAGRPSIVQKYPSIVTIVTEFIKQHGYRAQERRRTETGTTCGVTLREIRRRFLNYTLVLPLLLT